MIVFCLIACLFLTVSGVSAATLDDNSTQVEISTDTDLVSVGTLGVSDEMSSSAENRSVLGSSDDSKDLLSDSASKSYNDLYATITSGEKYIKLSHDYKYDSSVDTIKSFNLEYSYANMTIDGNGHTIDGNNLAAGFLIYGVNVTVKNLNFINMYVDNSIGRHGTAVHYYNSALYGKVLNCIFKNCLERDYNDQGTVKFGTTYSGRVAMYGVVDNCTFEKNIARDGAGICVGENYVNITNCIFKDNIASQIDDDSALNRGAAVYLLGSYNKFENCTFINNTQKAALASHGGGGAVCYYKGLNNSFYNCIFINNAATRGGAVYYNNAQATETKNGLFYNCTFINNTAHGESAKYYGTYNNISGLGGALFLVCPDNNIINCTFTGNTAKQDGGAVYINAANNNIINSTFINNTAKNEGGAIFANAQNLVVSNTDFKGNNAPKGLNIYSSDEGSYKFEGVSYDAMYISMTNTYTIEEAGGTSSSMPILWTEDIWKYLKTSMGETTISTHTNN